MKITATATNMTYTEAMREHTFYRRDYPVSSTASVSALLSSNRHNYLGIVSYMLHRADTLVILSTIVTSFCVIDKHGIVPK